ncbi:DNA alkylation response protein [Acidihalobacter ferrooxydans]|uniref:DNA alkylation response protein n=1 Tax=Acidihalobacter ferrooxydans TaxID=1765967 RepID=A0A1P8UL41_9GAMM|nr:DNA alkylation response protein [Acidihalobacter ferrooxydans]
MQSAHTQNLPAPDNQPTALSGYNAYTSDLALCEAAVWAGLDAADSRLTAYGAIAGSELYALGFAANDHPPEPVFFDPQGRRTNTVDFHPAYHRIMSLAKEHGLHSLTWTTPTAEARLVRSLLFYLHYPFESGTLCPLTMTHAAIPALRETPAVAAIWEPAILAPAYDPADRPAQDKRGLTIGMGMTEKQGGSDVRANTTRAVPLGSDASGEAYAINGHKWFFSAPMSDAFLVLAQAPGGLTCFLLPRWRPDGTRNTLALQRLKNKLGDHSNASSEVEFHDAWALRLGSEGRGVATIIQMVAETRLDCLLGSAALMRQAVSQALNHCRQRMAFGKTLLEQPLMRNVLADLALEAEAALWLALRVARAFAAAQQSESEALLKRLATPIGKYWVCKRAVPLVNEAQECLGGDGYVEDFLLARLYRQAPLNGLWEGSGNIQCLDILRALHKTPAALDALLTECATAREAEPRLDRHLHALVQDLKTAPDQEYAARRTAGRMAIALQASLLIQAAPSAVAEAFVASRLDGADGRAFGTLPDGLRIAELLERAMPR